MKKCFEDFPDGFTRNFKVGGLSKTDITDFATQFDPQRFHLNEEEARKTHFGGLVASGFQTQLLCFKVFCEEVLLNTWAVGAPGIDRLKWIRPWYPGEDLDVSVVLISKRQSSSRMDRGYLEFKLMAQSNNRPTLEMEWVVIVLTRDGAPGVEKA